MAMANTNLKKTDYRKTYRESLLRKKYYKALQLRDVNQGKSNIKTLR